MIPSLLSLIIEMSELPTTKYNAIGISVSFKGVTLKCDFSYWSYVGVHIYFFVILYCLTYYFISIFICFS